MLSKEAKALFAKLELPYSAVAVKYCFNEPTDYEKTDENLSFCQFARLAQDTGRTFYISKENDNCMGKKILGMVPMDGKMTSGGMGYNLGVFKTPAANARLYDLAPTLTPGAHNYVIFSPIEDCDFDPDIIIAVADIEKADILMRATSYISGDLWESKSSNVMSCAWTYAYTFISGKVNHCITGMHHGMIRRKVYPAGLCIISIPFQKIDEVVKALGEMDWELIAMKEDEESKAELARRLSTVHV